MVMTTSAHWPRSLVSFCGRLPAMSMPISRIASATTGCTCSAGRVPAERDSWRAPAARANSASLICDRPAFCLQTNRTFDIVRSDQDVEQRPSLRLQAAGQAIVGPDPGLADVDQSGLPQLR